MQSDQSLTANVVDRYDHKSFEAMGTTINLWIDRGSGAAGRMAFNTAVTFIERFDRELSRFSESSALSALNRDPHDEIPVSSLVARFVQTAIWAARFSDGLIDPTVIDSLEENGYRDSLSGRERAPLSDALAQAPMRCSANARANSSWSRIALDPDLSVIYRPPGLRLDSGGSGKGLAADMVAALWRQLLPDGTGWIVDCGGDMRMAQEPNSGDYEILLINPLTPEAPMTMRLTGGAVATSGIGSRLWRNADGSYAHHLIDPSTGRPAWTGVVSATALAPSTVEAETRAKSALLRGPLAAAELLSQYGGIVQHDDGTIHRFGPLDDRRANAKTIDGKEAA